MQKIDFVKTVASGNDFIIIDATRYPLPPTRLSYRKLAKKLCERKFGIGADGLLVVEPSQKADFRMRIFNPDGSEAEMCGNGARCVALWATQQIANQKPEIRIETKAGIIHATRFTFTPLNPRHNVGERQKPLFNGASASRQRIRIKMPQPKNLKLDIPVKIDKKTISVNFVKVGVPHTVVFVKNLEKIDVQGLGKKIREYQEFQPQGTNVNFVQVLDKDSIRIRTYERGVEQETLSCGTGSVAAALIANSTVSGVATTVAHAKWQIANSKISVHTQGEILKVYFDKQLKDIYLEGEARIVYEGTYAL